MVEGLKGHGERTLRRSTYLLLSSAASGVQGFRSSRQPTYPFNSLSLFIIASTSTLSNLVVYISSSARTEEERAYTVIRATTRCFIVPDKSYMRCSRFTADRAHYFGCLIRGLGHGSLVARNHFPCVHNLSRKIHTMKSLPVSILIDISSEELFINFLS